MGYHEHGERMHGAIRELYRAALRPKPLDSWSMILANLFDVELASFTVMAHTGIAVQNGGVGDGISAGQEYLDRYQHVNPFREFWLRATSGQVFRLDGDLIGREVRRTEFYARYGAHLDSGECLCMPLSIRNAKVLVHAGEPKRGRLGHVKQQQMRQIGNDLLTAFEIAGTIALSTQLVDNVIASLDQKGIGVALLSESGTIEHVNHSMNDLLETGDILKIDHSGLTGGVALHLPEFSSMVHRTRRSGVGGRLFYSDGPNGRHGSIIACPAPVTFDWAGPSESKVVLLVTDSSRQKSVLSTRLRQIYGLTLSEMRIANMLLDGKTSRQMADELGIQINSIRAHLKAVFAKTNTHSQVELLKLLQMEREQAL